MLQKSNAPKVTDQGQAIIPHQKIRFLFNFSTIPQNK